MLCQNCKKNKATHQFTNLSNGIIKDVRLCDQCAEEYSKKPYNVNENIPFTIQDLLASLMDIEFQEVTEKKSDRFCPKCGSTYARFKTIGRVGCDQCYETFKDELYPLIRRVQGNMQHKGKQHNVELAGNADGGKKIRNDITVLKARLQKALKAEEFEKAAEIRDKIKLLESGE